MAFHEIRFPTGLSFGSSGGPERRTEVVTLASGHEERNAPWAHSRRHYDAGMGLRSLDDLDAVVTFFEARAGRLHGFRWKDWADFKSCRPSGAPDGNDQHLGTGDEIRTEFALRKRYGSGEGEYLRPITKPLAGSVQITVGSEAVLEGRDYTVDHTTGLVTFTHPPDTGAEVRAGFQFDVPVRFDTDRIVTAVSTFQAGEVPSIPVVEVRT